jgi:hypothetical protein
MMPRVNSCESSTAMSNVGESTIVAPGPIAAFPGSSSVPVAPMRPSARTLPVMRVSPVNTICRRSRARSTFSSSISPRAASIAVL